MSKFPLVPISFLSVSLLICTLLANSALAQSIIIQDCNGFTRGVKSADPSGANKVEVSVSDAGGAPADGSQVTLTNSVTGESITTVAQNGVAVFENVAPGMFTVTTASDALVVGTIGVGSMGAGIAASTGAAIVGGGAIAGTGAVAVPLAVEVVESDEDDEPEATPTPAPTATPQPPAPTPQPTPEPTPDDCNCDPNAEPTPIDDFFQANQDNLPARRPSQPIAQSKEISPFR
ncbi:MAG: carboxypeptidase regulatory-like domain-containing protein [Deltaproteobacteria bacterium]|nr:carboxypeptidase regulatory-like domain-containing protein [Deltaproteobacteria bacterium]